jgi:hypothetical protein
MNNEIPIGTKVLVYRNLHKKCFSVVDTKTGKVISHTQSIDLDNVTFKVRECGRQKVISTKQKNVHAFVCGTVCGSPPATERWRGVGYNPYFSSSFFDTESKEAINKAFCAKLRNGKDILAKIDL